MSVVILGGNECMTRRYTDICKKYSCTAKVYHKMCNGIKSIGSPDLMILFTDTMSHKMVRSAMKEIDENTKVARSRSSSATALKNILEEHICRSKQ